MDDSDWLPYAAAEDDALSAALGVWNSLWLGIAAWSSAMLVAAHFW